MLSPWQVAVRSIMFEGEAYHLGCRWELSNWAPKTPEMIVQPVLLGVVW